MTIFAALQIGSGEGLSQALSGSPMLALATLFRRQWIAVLGVMAYAGLLGLANAGPLWAFHAAAWTAIVLVALVRLGLLATVVLQAVTNLIRLTPLTHDLSAWYASGTILVLATVTVLAGYGFHTALAGRSLFGADLLRD